MRFVLAALMLAACASPPPYFCTSPTDMTMRGIPLCRGAMQDPVCDAPGAMATYTMDPLTGGYVLQNGMLAVCDTSNQVVCQDRSESPHCIVHPSSP